MITRGVRGMASVSAGLLMRETMERREGRVSQMIVWRHAETVVVT